MSKLNQSSLTLGEYVNGQILYGIKTGYNQAFFIDEHTYSYLIKRDPKNSEIIKSLVVGDDVRKYEINFQNSYLIFARRGVNIDNYPSIKGYLNKFRQELEPRLKDHTGDWSGRKAGSYQWYEIQDSIDYWEEFEKPKIIYPIIAKEPRFTFDDQGYYANDKCFIIPHPDFYLLSLLNSNLIFNTAKLLVSVLGDEDAGGRLELRAIHLQNLPIRKINFTTPTDRRQQALQNAIALYNQLQLNHNADPLLAQVNHHLIQQPEEADIIHDLLAHLSEQMIELNKQKQTEIKSFLQWLERFIGCPIDILTNKSKIQNYLGDYYKKRTGIADNENDTGAPHLSFNDLIELLKKNKKKIKIDPVARKEQQTLEKEYQASLETLLPLKMQLMRCDRLIDAIVYQLYGLSEEERAIVEGRSAKDTNSKEVN